MTGAAERARIARFARVRELFEEVSELPPAEREARLRARCPDDAEVRAEVARMLALEDAEFLERPGELDDLAASPAPPEPRPPESVGPYRVLRRLGAGGMGVVYEALQESPRRRVALKMLRAGFASPSVARRFRYEVEVLGRLRHPGIAQIHEAGVHTGAGGEEVPFFAMEYVEGGTDLLAWAERAGASTEERVRLLIDVCEAVHHGHTQGVVHRDLKPANVLVDASGRPRVIDFGVARVVDGSDARTEATRPGELVGTLRRMSPEQLAGDAARIDTRTDVYALGLLLYELLCGRLPYDVEGLGWTEIAAVIREAPPVDPRRLEPALPRELAWIALRALEKDPERRYASVSELAADLERSLADEPVLAGPPSGAYRALKLLRRHRLAVAAALLVALALVAGTAVAAVGAVRARRAEARARAESARAGTLADLTAGLFRSIGAFERGSDVRLVEVLRGASYDERALAREPAVEAEFRGLLGTSFLTLGEYAEARGHLEPALHAARESAGPDAPLTLRLARDLASALRVTGAPEEARALLDDTLERSERALGPDHVETVHTRAARTLSFTEVGAPGRLAALEELRVLAGGVLPPDDSLHTTLELEVVRELQARNRGDEALRRVDALVGALAAEVPPDDPRLLAARRDRAVLLRRSGDLLGAEAELETLVPGWLRRFGASSEYTGQVMVELATVKRFLDRHDEAAAIVERELALREPLADEGDELVAELRFERADLLYQRGALGRSEEAHLRAVDALTACCGAADIRTLEARGGLARVWIGMGRHDQAERLLREVVADVESAFGPGSRRLVPFLTLLGDLLVAWDPEEALARLERAADIARASLPPSHGDRLSALSVLGIALHETDRLEQAEAVLVEARAALPPGGARRALRELVAEHLARVRARLPAPSDG